MSAATTGFIAGMFVGGLTVFVMMSVIITASRADEREERLFEEYLRKIREEERPTMNEIREAFGFPPVEKEDEC